MDAIKLPDGSLKITASQEDREGLLEIYAESGKGYLGADTDINGALYDLGFYRVEPEWLGALTDAPIFSDDVDFPDSPEETPDVRGGVWWYPSYQILDPWEELAKHGEVIFQNGREN